MSIDPGVLKRLLNLKIIVEGSASWAFRELLDYILEILEERMPIIINEAVEPYELEASILERRGCDVFPQEDRCGDIVVVGLYEKDSDKPLVYAGYLITRGDNILEVKLLRIIDALTGEAI